MTKLVVSVLTKFKVVTQVASEKAVAAVYKSRLKLAYITGIFLRLLIRADAVTVQDTSSKSITKGSADSAALTDTKAVGVTKGITDAGSLADSLARTVIFNRDFTDNLTTTDDLDSTASVEDDQVALVTKSVSDSAGLTDTEVAVVTKPLTDSSTLTDVEATAVTKPLTDSGTLTESGVIALPNYADPAYFAGDYVVDYRTF